jgi:hypothetical protein
MVTSAGFVALICGVKYGGSHYAFIGGNDPLRQCTKDHTEGRSKKISRIASPLGSVNPRINCLGLQLHKCTPRVDWEIMEAVGPRTSP